jgi:hypothetical protein
VELLATMTQTSKEVPELHVLKFPRLWDSFTSERLVFDDVIDVKKRSISVVAFRNDLTTYRNAALDASLHNNEPDYVMQQCAFFFRAMLKQLVKSDFGCTIVISAGSCR